MKSIFLALLFSASHAFALTIGFLPGGDPVSMKKGAVQIAQGLQDQLHVPVNVYFSKDYAGLVEAMKLKKVDFAFFTSATYVFAEKEAGAKVLLKKVYSEPFYHSVILALKGSKISKPTDLKGKKLAFVDQKSTSGALYPQLMLKRKKIEIGEQKYTGSHSQSVAALDAKEVDAIAVFADDKKGLQNAYLKYSKAEHPLNNFKVIWISEPIPNDPFCVRQDFYDQDPKLVHSLMFSLIDVVETLKDKKEVLEAVGGTSFVPATQKQYDSVREMVKELNLQL